MARAGEPVTTIRAWLGHGDLKTTQRYMHYAPPADEAERVERAFTVAPGDSEQAANGVSEIVPRYLRWVMSEPRDDQIAPLIRELD